MSIRVLQIPGCVGRVGFFGFLAVASDCRLAARGQPRKMFFHNLSGFWVLRIRLESSRQRSR